MKTYKELDRRQQKLFNWIDMTFVQVKWLTKKDFAEVIGALYLKWKRNL